MTLRVITFKLEETILEKIDKLAKRRRVPRSTIIREALREYIQRNMYTDKRKWKPTIETIKIW